MEAESIRVPPITEFLELVSLYNLVINASGIESAAQNQFLEGVFANVICWN